MRGRRDAAYFPSMSATVTTVKDSGRNSEACKIIVEIVIPLLYFVSFACLCLTSIFLTVLRAEMGQASSNSCLSPLECFIKNFQDFKKRAEGYGVSVDAFTLRKFCELEWPTFNVDWPSTGTYDINLCLGVRQVVYGRPGHPDQIPYIDVWIDILTDQPSWLKRCQCAERKLGDRRLSWWQGHQSGGQDPDIGGRVSLGRRRFSQDRRRMRNSPRPETPSIMRLHSQKSQHRRPHLFPQTRPSRETHSVLPTLGLVLSLGQVIRPRFCP